MPQMGVSVSEGTITKWLKQDGEPIEADETLLEISTDKVDTEVPSPGSGVVQEILVQEGETVEVGTKLAVIAPEGAAPLPKRRRARAARARRRSRPRASASAASPRRAARSRRHRPRRAAPAPAATAPANGKTFVSPVVARIASEHGVDPAQVPGTGRGGRVTKKDILAFIEAGAPATRRRAASRSPRPRPARAAGAAPHRARAGAAAPPAEPRSPARRSSR